MMYKRLTVLREMPEMARGSVNNKYAVCPNVQGNEVSVSSNSEGGLVKSLKPEFIQLGNLRLKVPRGSMYDPVSERFVSARDEPIEYSRLCERLGCGINNDSERHVVGGQIGYQF